MIKDYYNHENIIYFSLAVGFVLFVFFVDHFGPGSYSYLGGYVVTAGSVYVVWLSLKFAIAKKRAINEALQRTKELDQRITLLEQWAKEKQKKE